MAVVAVVPAVPTHQPVAGVGLLARNRAPLQPPSAAGDPPPRGPDPPGRCSLADGAHRWDQDSAGLLLTYGLALKGAHLSLWLCRVWGEGGGVRHRPE